MFSVILDEDVMEHIIKFNREDEVEFDNMSIVERTREGNKIVWVARREPTEHVTVKEILVRAPSLCFGLKDAVRIYDPLGIPLRPGDTLNLTYTIEWWWEGRDGEDYVRLPFPTPGAELRFECCIAA